MLGPSHAASGLALASASLLAFPQLSSRPESTITTLVVVSGSALLPDLDHAGAKISKSLGPLSRGLSHVVGAISGGHRKGTHTVLGAAIFGALAYLIAANPWTLTLPWNLPSLPNLGVGLFTALLASLVVGCALPGIASNVSAIAMVYIAAQAPTDPLLFAALVAAGCLAHSWLGDVLTTQGVPGPLWPLTRRNVRFPILGDTGSGREGLYVTILSVVTLLCLYIFLTNGPVWSLSL